MTLFQASFSFTRLILPAETSWFRVASDSLDFLAALFSAMKPHVAQLAIVDSLLTAALIRSGFTPSYPSRDRRPFLAHEGFLAGYPIPLVIGRLSVDLEKLPRSPCNRIHYSLGNGNEEPSAPPHRASRVQNCSRGGYRRYSYMFDSATGNRDAAKQLIRRSRGIELSNQIILTPTSKRSNARVSCKLNLRCSY